MLFTVCLILLDLGLVPCLAFVSCGRHARRLDGETRNPGSRGPQRVQNGANASCGVVCTYLHAAQLHSC
jgi:hypothetical protein